MNDQINPTRQSEDTTGHAGQTHTGSLGAPNPPVNLNAADGKSASGGTPKPDQDVSKDSAPHQQGLTQKAIDELKSQGSGSLSGGVEGLVRESRSAGGEVRPGIAGGIMRAPRPAIGRIVHYTVTGDQARQINNRRAHADAHRSAHKAAANGTVVHVGSSVSEGRRFPMIITAVHGDDPHSLVNGQVFLDGNDSLWVTSVARGTQPGNYDWPQRD